MKISLIAAITILLIGIPLISSFTIMKDNTQIRVDVPSNLNISQAEIFHGMTVNYTFDDDGTIYNSGFSYEYDSGSNYNVSWWIDGPGIVRWVENEESRVISMSGGPYSFDDGSHAPIWIFTNVSLYDLVPISVDGDGDHIFNITSERIFSIPGFGSVEVWELEDLSFPGGIAWYEKSTGILIKGYFLYDVSYYTLEFTNANIVFSNVPPVSGLFDGLYMIYNITESGSARFNISYEGDSINTYHCTVDFLTPGDDDWIEDTTSRLMSNIGGTGLNFAPGLYTPFWIFTNVSLYDLVPIAVDGEGDHVFNITKDKVFNIPGMGSVEVWQLEDLDGHGGVALYEKKTGILLNSTFYYASGADYYHLTLSDTNAIFGYTDGGEIPGYNIFFLILAVLSVTMILFKKGETIHRAK